MDHHLRTDGFGIHPSPSPSIYSVESSLQQDRITKAEGHVDDIAPSPVRHPLAQASPVNASASSISGSSSAIQNHYQNQSRRYFRSRRVKKGEVEQSWKTAKKDPREKWVTIIPLIGLALGFAIAGFLIYDGLRTIVNHKYNLILDEDWSGGLDAAIWKQEVTVGGFGYVDKTQTSRSFMLNFCSVTVNSNKLPVQTRMYTSRTANCT